MNKSFEIEYWRRENWEDHGWNFHFAYGLADGVSFADAHGRINCSSKMFVCGDDDEVLDWRFNKGVLRIDVEDMWAYNSSNYRLVLGVRRWLRDMNYETERVEHGFKGLYNYYGTHDVFRSQEAWWWNNFRNPNAEHGGFEEGVEYYGKMDMRLKLLRLENYYGQSVPMALDCFEPMR